MFEMYNITSFVWMNSHFLSHYITIKQLEVGYYYLGFKWTCIQNAYDCRFIKFITEVWRARMPYLDVALLFADPVGAFLAVTLLLALPRGPSPP